MIAEDWPMRIVFVLTFTLSGFIFGMWWATPSEPELEHYTYSEYAFAVSDKLECNQIHMCTIDVQRIGQHGSERVDNVRCLILEGETLREAVYWKEDPE